jgi:hypothetical protein
VGSRDGFGQGMVESNMCVEKEEIDDSLPIPNEANTGEVTVGDWAWVLSK